jgi:hypothetical protein
MSCHVMCAQKISKRRDAGVDELIHELRITSSASVQLPKCRTHIQSPFLTGPLTDALVSMWQSYYVNSCD